MASPAPVGPFSQPELLGPFLQHFVRQSDALYSAPAGLRDAGGSGGSAVSTPSFSTGVLGGGLALG